MGWSAGAGQRSASPSAPTRYAALPSAASQSSPAVAGVAGVARVGRSVGVRGVRRPQELGQLGVGCPVELTVLPSSPSIRKVMSSQPQCSAPRKEWTTRSGTRSPSGVRPHLDAERRRWSPAATRPGRTRRTTRRPSRGRRPAPSVSSRTTKAATTSPASTGEQRLRRRAGRSRRTPAGRWRPSSSSQSSSAARRRRPAPTPARCRSCPCPSAYGVPGAVERLGREPGTSGPWSVAAARRREQRRAASTARRRTGLGRARHPDRIPASARCRSQLRLDLLVRRVVEGDQPRLLDLGVGGPEHLERRRRSRRPWASRRHPR